MIGFINVYKPSGMTSNAVVQKIKKHFHVNKIGHMGTLDPMACGLLPIAIGKATRLFDFVLNKKKTYNVIFDFGYETDTLDVTGNKIKENDIIVTPKLILENLHKLIGKMSQMPPKFSAKNVNGVRAYDLARKGIDFELKPKEIEIFQLELIREIDVNRFEFKVVCSGGTYIRAIGRDLAEILGTYATMSYLERSDLEFFNLDNSFTLEEILKTDNICDVLLSPLQVLSNFDIINIDYETYKDLLNGKFVCHEKIEKNSFVLYNDKLIGIAKHRDNQLKIDCYLEDEI